MRAPISLRRLVLSSLLLAGAGTFACSGWQPPWSKAPALAEQAWQRQTVLVESGSLGTPSVIVDASGRPAVALADRASYMGQQSIALARRVDDGWRVEFPITPSAWRVCARWGEGGTVVVTHGPLEDGPLEAALWDGTATAPAEPGPCPRTSSDVREAQNAAGTHQLERSRDGKTLWHAAPSAPCPALDAAPGSRFGAFNFAIDDAGHVAVVYFERPDTDGPASGRLLHASCGGAAFGAAGDEHARPPKESWTSSLVADGVRVTEVGVGLDAAGRSHVAYVAAGDDGKERLVHAMPVDGPPAPEVAGDARIVPAIEACLRMREDPSRETGVERYQQGDGFRCAVLQRDPASSQQALALLDRRCEAGEAPACALAGSLHHWLMGDVSFVLELAGGDTTRFHSEWRGLRPEGLPEDVAEAGRRYARACELGDPRACLHHAAVLPSDDPRRLAHATIACEAGLAHGCALTLAAGGLRPDAAMLALVEPPLRTACEADDMAACNDLGVMLHLRGDATAAATEFGRACGAKLELACRNAERLRKQ
jgi:hypothetical protein